MPIDKTLEHKQVNRRSVEPSFFAPVILPTTASKNSSSSQSRGRKAKSNAKSILQPGQRAQQDGLVTLGKHGHPPVATEALKRSRVQEDHLAQFDPDETTYRTTRGAWLETNGGIGVWLFLVRLEGRFSKSLSYVQ
jgi:hypothetical protein